MIQLDERLAAAAALVRSGSRVADVGADHGYLIARLLLDGTATFGYACDIHQKPLEKAEQTLSAHGLTDRSALLLGDGLAGLSPDWVDDVVIAGMGGDMILHILDDAGWKDSRHRFILQPMTKVHQLREGLYRRGYEILAEKAASVGGFAYTVMQVCFTGGEKAIDPVFARVGLLPRESSAAAVEYVLKQAESVETIADGMAKSDTNREKSIKYYYLAKKLRQIHAQMKGEV